MGERIELRRRRLGLSRRVVAQLAGRSEEWLRKIECGGSLLDSIQITYRLAEVLHFDDPMELIGWPTSSRSVARGMDLQLTALNRAIMDHPSTRAFATNTEQPLPELDSVRASLEQCRATWFGSPHRYTELAARLPAVLVAARSIRAAAHTTPGGPVAEAGGVLADAYHLARLLLTRVGDYHMAWLVSDRPIGILTHPEHPTRIAVSSWHVASALLSLGYLAESRDYALAAARRLTRAALPERLAGPAHGALLLVAAEGAAGTGDLTLSEALMAEAGQVAAKLDPNRPAEVPDSHAPDYTVSFGRAEVVITGMNIALQLGRVDDAIRLSADVDLPEDASADLEVRYYLTTAYAYGQRGEDFAAVFALQQAEHACPEDIRYDWMAHRTLQKLSRHDHHLIRRDLTKLLTVAGLA
ncbi:helix-turn-helix transcriptional regulator [Nocardia sp. JMUB6875]